MRSASRRTSSKLISRSTLTKFRIVPIDPMRCPFERPNNGMPTPLFVRIERKNTVDLDSARRLPTDAGYPRSKAPVEHLNR